MNAFGHRGVVVTVTLGAVRRREVRAGHRVVAGVDNPQGWEWNGMEWDGMGSPPGGSAIAAVSRSCS